MKHTEGPWTLKVMYASDVVVYPVHGERNVCSISLHQPDPAEVRANAHLIAAAPEMFELLRDLATHAGCKDPRFRPLAHEAVRLIAKIVGGDK